ncbi:MAG: ANTAR domain-containing protein [Firmicutes bacterium]|nr:ANTAR domain-containing protein [Bacillota bacterium]
MVFLDSILIISGEKGQQSLVQMININFATPAITMATSANEARRIMSSQDFELIIINAPLLDENGQDLAMMAAQQSSAYVILLYKSDLLNLLQPHLEENGVIVLQKPLNRITFEQTLSMVTITNQRLAKLQAENRKLTRKLDELRLVSRAKCLLIAERSWTEPEAHSYIERLAMDRRETKLAIAEEIIKTYVKI